MAVPEIKIKLMGGKVPDYKTSGAACADCVSKVDKWVWLKPVLIPLGFALQIPEGWEAVIRPRSGMNKKGHFGLIGTIDSDYRGEVHAMMWSLLPYKVKKGDRVCQMFFDEVKKIKFCLATELDETERGNGGFGSTGK